MGRVAGGARLPKDDLVAVAGVPYAHAARRLVVGMAAVPVAMLARRTLRRLGGRRLGAAFGARPGAVRLGIWLCVRLGGALWLGAVGFGAVRLGGVVAAVAVVVAVTAGRGRFAVRIGARQARAAALVGGRDRVAVRVRARQARAARVRVADGIVPALITRERVIRTAFDGLGVRLSRLSRGERHDGQNGHECQQRAQRCGGSFGHGGSTPLSNRWLCVIHGRVARCGGTHASVPSVRSARL